MILPRLTKFVLGLFLGIFLVFLPAVLAQERLLWEFSFLDRLKVSFNPKLAYRLWIQMLGKTPRWLRASSVALLVYAVALFAGFAYRTFPASVNSLENLDMIQLMSAYAAAFCSAAAALLSSYAN